MYIYIYIYTQMVTEVIHNYKAEKRGKGMLGRIGMYGETSLVRKHFSRDLIT